MENNIITTLVSQHRELKKNLSCVADQLNLENPNITEIGLCLNKFSNNLSEHLLLENNVFYVNLLKTMKGKGQDIVKTEKFILEMKGIEVAVEEFLGKFKSEELIRKNINVLKKDLPGIIDTLGLRVETEEAGVYAYWGLF